MKNLWKIMLWALALLSVLFVLGSCGDDEPEETPNEGTHTCAGVRWVTEKEATCTEEGSKKFVCSCGKTVKTEKIPLAEHTEEVVPGKAATCKETGLTDGKKCSVCDETLVAQTEIPLASHTEETVPGRAATCEQTGLTDGKKCSVCGVTLVARTTIPLAPHTEQTLPGRAATCEQTGLTDGKKCSVCGETLVAQTEIPIDPDAHNMVNGTCTLCGCSIVTEIRTVADLRNIASNLNANYILMNDLDLGGMEWTPIGTNYNNPFTGTFDGNGHVIKNFKITSEMQYAGLFGYSEGTIQNIGLENFTIDVSYSDTIFAGSLVGINYGGTITNCYAAGDVSASRTSYSASVGGLVGGNTGTITNCYATGDVSATASSTSSLAYADAGGLAGKNSGSNAAITNSYATGDVSASSTSTSYYTNASAGGLVGETLHGTITNCYATGAVGSTASSTSSSSTSSSYHACAEAGGLVGGNYYATITNCYATGDVSVSSTSTSSDAYAYAGGLVGRNYGTTSAPATITNCYATGDVSVSSTSTSSDAYAYAGGLVGSNEGTITNCYRYSGQSFTVTKGSTTTYSATNAEGTATDMATLQSVDFQQNTLLWSAEDWIFAEGAHPVLNEVVEITTKEDLLALQTGGLDGKYKLMADIDLGGMEWTPIGTFDTPFTGTFDGNGHVIKNFKITGDVQYAGLFGYSNGTIQNIGLENFTIDVSRSGYIYAGGLVGWNSGTITNSYATGDVSASASSFAYAGGLVGEDYYSGTITNCYATGAVSATASSTSTSSSAYARAGGLVGEGSGTITNSYATGDVSVSSTNSRVHAGGLVGGINYYGTITNSYATGDVSASSTSGAYAGGLVGDNWGGTITNCYATGDVSATASSTIYNASAYAGGLVGENDGYISNCYRYSGQSFTVTVNGTTTYEATNTDGTATDMATLQSVSFHQSTLLWSAGDWNFAEGAHPTLK